MTTQDALAASDAARYSTFPRWKLLADRTAVLFVGVAAGAMIGLSFANHQSGSTQTAAPVPPAAIIVPPAATPQHAAAPAVDPVNPALAGAVAEHRPLAIGVFGDSFGQGLWEGLYLQFKGDQGYGVRNFAKQGTGFTRYSKLNLLDDLRTKLDAQPVDIAVVSFGANDAFDIYSGMNVYRYMSPEWQKMIGERVDAYVGLLRARGVNVYWVGLPRMREPEFDAKIAQMNAFYAARMQALGVPFIDTVPLSVGPDGRYTDRITDPKTGKSEQIRAGDGIHMRTGHAYGYLTRGLSARIHQVVAAAKAAPEHQAAL